MITLLMDLAANARKAITAAQAKYHPGCQPGDLANVILAEIKGWEPRYKGQPVLTQSLRVKLSAALGDLAWNVASIDAKKGG